MADRQAPGGAFVVEPSVGRQAQIPGGFYWVLDIADITPAGQILTPDADLVTTNWSPSTGITLYECIDEASPGSDADYVYTSTVNAEFEVALSDGLPPASGTRTLKVRTHSALVPVGSMIVSLFNGASEVQAFTTLVPVAASTYAFTVTNPVSDYGNLRVKVKSGS